MSRGRILLALGVAVLLTAVPARALTSPLATIDDGPDKQTKKHVARFAFSSDDPAATFECRLDDSGFGPCSSPFVVTRLDRGRHVFEVRALSPTGAVSAPASQRWKVLKK